MNKAYSEDESVSGKSYKKKLQEELFERSKQEQDGAGPGHAKRKWRGEPSESDEVPSPKKKKIKREPESDHDASTNRNKNNGIHQSESHDTFDESYLDLKVKDEQHFAPPHRTKAKRSIDKSLSNSDILSESSESKQSTKRKNKSKNHSMSDNQSEDNTLNELVQEESEYNERLMKKKKKKSKKRKDSTVSDDVKPEDCDVPETASASGGRDLLPAAQGKDHNKNSNLNEEVSNEVTSSIKRQNSSVNLYENNAEKRKTRISERIQFEDENSDLETSKFNTTESLKKSDKLKKYSKENLHLKPLKTMLDNNEATLTTEDEIWLIRCPKNVHVDSFQDKEVTLEGKCKLKLNGQTYEGSIDKEPGNMSILSSERSHFVIKSCLVKGFLNLRKRIPKTHIQDDIALNINQASFIPLPETKSRHPLFGHNYKKSIKLAAHVTERLNTTTSQYKKTKTRKEKSFNSDQDHFSITTPKEECSTSIANANVSDPKLPELEQVGSRKKNKHKKNRNEDAAPKTKKKYKHDLESVEAWDSEKAIEENLFNF